MVEVISPEEKLDLAMQSFKEGFEREQSMRERELALAEALKAVHVYAACKFAKNRGIKHEAVRVADEQSQVREESNASEESYARENDEEVKVSVILDY